MQVSQAASRERGIALRDSPPGFFERELPQIIQDCRKGSAGASRPAKSICEKTCLQLGANGVFRPVILVRMEQAKYD
jgi:hypothetical protein